MDAHNKYSRGSYGYIAYKDLEAAMSVYKLDLYNLCIVNLQQAAEKICKEKLLSNLDVSFDKELLRSHKVHRLIAPLLPLYPKLKEHRPVMCELSSAYFDVRYPGVDYIEFDKQGAAEMLGAVLSVFEILESEPAIPASEEPTVPASEEPTVPAYQHIQISKLSLGNNS